MSQQPDSVRETIELLDRLLDGEFTDADRQRLNALTLADPDARRCYRSYMSLHGSLAWLSDQNLQRKLADLQLHSDLAEPGIAAAAVADEAALPAAAGPNAAPRSPVLGFLTGSFESLPFSPLRLIGGVVGASLFWLVMAFWVLPWWRGGQDPLALESPVARLANAEECRWRAVPPRGAAGLENEELQLVEGVAQVALATGTRLQVIAPATFRIESSSIVHLTQGKLLANVPHEAIGFVVATPCAKVVDLGTEFSVEVAQGGNTDVHVLRGKVEVEPTAGPATATGSVARLNAGEAVRVTRQGQERIAIDATGFARMASGDAARGRPVDLKMENSIWLGNLFDDPKGTALWQGMRSDTFRSFADNDDLGIESVVYGGGPRQKIGGVSFDLTNLGWSHGCSGRISNDSWSDMPTGGGMPRFGPLRTLGQRGPEVEIGQPKIEEGFGVHSSCLLTFDLDEIRAAGKLSDQRLTFVCDRVGANDVVFNTPAEVYLAVLVTDGQKILAAALNGNPTDVVIHDEYWSLAGPIGEAVKSDGRFATFRLECPLEARYLSLITAAAGFEGWDHIVWSGARLEVAPAVGGSRRPLRNYQ